MGENAVRNNIYTRSYTSKRLREAGFIVKNLGIEYAEYDKRYWSVLINIPNNACNIVMTCLRKSLVSKKGEFVFQSPKCDRFILETMSADVIADTIRSLSER